MNHNQIEPKTCRVCNNHNTRKKSGYQYSWFQCANCLTINRDITELEFTTINPSYDPGDFYKELSINNLKKILDIETKKRFLTNNLRNYSSFSTLKLLDIGCGMGGYLIAGQELGISCTGIEPSLSHSAIGRNVFGLNIINTPFDESFRQVERYDIILLSHVLEHIFKPKEFLELVFANLTTSGVALITTPNIESLSAKFAGKYWSMFKPVDHVTLIGPTAIPFICPSHTQYSYITSEYLAEFLVSIFISLRDRFKEFSSFITARHLKDKNDTPAIINVVSSPQKRLAWNLLTLANFPFFLITKLLNKQACLSIRITTKQLSEHH